jgi:hypothetical protein
VGGREELAEAEEMIRSFKVQRLRYDLTTIPSVKRGHWVCNSSKIKGYKFNR